MSGHSSPTSRELGEGRAHFCPGREGEMPNDGIGSSLWRNVQAVKVGKDGGIEASVRAM
jgi:hypothetical protein